jgi:hypothetical protein
MAQEYKVMASSLTATYTAGRFVANSSAEAIEMARESYRNSDLGRRLNDVRAFRFYVVDQFPHERED